LRAQLQAVTGQLDQVGGEYGFANVGGTLVRTDTRRGEAVPVFTPPPQPDIREVGGALVRIGPDNQAQELYRAPPPPPAMMTPYQQQSLALQARGLGLREETARQPSATQQRMSAQQDVLRRTQAATLAEIEQKNQLVQKDIARASEIIRRGSSVAGLGGLTGFIPGTDTANLTALLDTIRANVGFNELAAMRQNSPTGAALGGVSDRDVILLTSVLGSLETSQSEDQLLYNLDRLGELLAGRDQRLRQAFEADFGNASTGPASDDVQDLLDLYGDGGNGDAR